MCDGEPFPAAAAAAASSVSMSAASSSTGPSLSQRITALEAKIAAAETAGAPWTYLTPLQQQLAGLQEEKNLLLKQQIEGGGGENTIARGEGTAQGDGMLSLILSVSLLCLLYPIVTVRCLSIYRWKSSAQEAC